MEQRLPRRPAGKGTAARLRFHGLLLQDSAFPCDTADHDNGFQRYAAPRPTGRVVLGMVRPLPCVSTTFAATGVLAKTPPLPVGQRRPGRPRGNAHPARLARHNPGALGEDAAARAAQVASEGARPQPTGARARCLSLTFHCLSLNFRCLYHCLSNRVVHRGLDPTGACSHWRDCHFADALSLHRY